METRFNGKVVPFASGASSGERTIFGDWSTSSDDINANLNADFIAGWENGLEGTLNPYPPSQYFNAALYTVSSLVSYLYQQGVAEWNTNQDYLLNSYCIASNGKIYRAKTGTTGSPNNGNNPISDAINWDSLDSKFVDLLSNQTIEGIKNFTSFPITPSVAPTSSYQVANKKYVDDNKGLGYAQSYQDMTGSRSEGVTYTNTTGKTILVLVSSTDVGNPNYGTYTINGVEFYWGGGEIPSAIPMIIPNGSTYSWTSTTGGIRRWYELR